jgi:hypothetical protein
MSEFNDLMKMLEVGEIKSTQVVAQDQVDPFIFQQDVVTPQKTSSYEILPNLPINYDLFNIDVFIKELYERSSVKNQLYREVIQNISAYDISSGCMRDIIYKLNNTPVESFADKWLPILMRSTIGTAIHDFIQNNTNQFTEREVSLKIPSIRFSGRLDNLIGPEKLIEIKSCPYSDYEKIITTRKPRVSDFYQAMTYKYILENYLIEARDPAIIVRKGTVKPKFDKYDIKTVQFIYVAHDVTATDVSSFAEILHRITELKRLLNSKSNSFFFITTMVVDVTNGVAAPFLDYVDKKIKAINHYIDTNTVPDKTDPFIDTKACFFCMYRKLCDVK